MAVTGPSVTVEQLRTLLRAFLLQILPSGWQVVQGQANRVPEVSVDTYVVISPPVLRRLATTVDTWAGADATLMSHQQDVEATVQLDVHGATSGDACLMITTLLRSPFGVGFFGGSGITPLWCDDADQIPFVSGEDQWEDRYVLKPRFELDVVATTTQQFAATLEVAIETPADALAA